MKNKVIIVLLLLVVLALFWAITGGMGVFAHTYKSRYLGGDIIIEKQDRPLFFDQTRVFLAGNACIKSGEVYEISIGDQEPDFLACSADKQYLTLSGGPEDGQAVSVKKLESAISDNHSL